MNCVICQIGTTQRERVTATLERDGAILIVKDVLANGCQPCGGRYFEAETTDQPLALADRAFEQGTELEIIRLKAAA